MFINRICGVGDYGHMAKKTGLENIKLYHPRRMGELAITYIKSLFVPRVRRGLDYRGNFFKGYTEDYAEMKRGGFKKKDGGRLKRYAGIPVNTQPDPVNLTVTRTTLKSMEVFAFDKKGFEVGFQGQSASVISGQNDQGRDIVSGIPNKEEGWLMQKIADMPDPEIRKLKNITINVKIV